MLHPGSKLEFWPLSPLLVLQKHMGLCPRRIRPAIKSICNNPCKVVRKPCCCLHFTSNKLKGLSVIFFFNHSAATAAVWASKTSPLSTSAESLLFTLTAEPGEINNTKQLSESAEVVQGSHIETHQVFTAGKAPHLINTGKKPLIHQAHQGATSVMREGDGWRKEVESVTPAEGEKSVSSEPQNIVYCILYSSLFWAHILHKYMDPEQRQKTNFSSTVMLGCLRAGAPQASWMPSPLASHPANPAISKRLCSHYTLWKG